MFSLNKIHDNPFGGIGSRYASYIDRDHFLGRSAMDDALWSSKRAKSNVKRSDNEYHIEIAVPGFSKEEVSVSLDGDHLVVECIKTELPDKVPVQIHQEYGQNQISRSFVIPNDVDTDGIKSECKNGILSINLPVQNRQKRSVTVK